MHETMPAICPASPTSGPSRIRIRRFVSASVCCLSALLFFCLLPAALPAAQQKEEGKPFIIGLLPELNVFQQQQRFQPLADYLSKQLQRDVRLTMLSRYGNILEQVEKHQVDAAFFGSFTGALAIRQLGVIPLARPVALDGTSTYTGHIFVRQDSGINSVADMKGKRLALVEKATTAGYIFPVALVRKEAGGVAIDQYFEQIFFTGSHDAAIKAVIAGQAEVGAAKNSVYDWFCQREPDAAKKLKILYTSPPVPQNGLAIRAGEDPELRKKLKALLLGLHNDTEGLAVLQKLGASRFTETREDDYKPVYDLAAEAGIDLMNYSYVNQ